ncbi:GNAT family N-acetyltransferase [Mesorhizobium sp. B261B1A]|uniref:GNAT family N-acetyltransferase n=1 Tax=Mesorhizobium sp. B261B1A TaxID=2876671 RepID=UPI001CD15A88|nr:GNAT family N-acetyltransferase [Mesorhizobium sp. B261B1A]MCA0059225.1 GNAT family N-acetyltransferase [Mesorhizobium sp. B261B1A]
MAPEHQNRGIGTALVRAIEAHATSLGVEALYLYTWEARDFYMRLGWRVVEPFRQNGEPMALMSRQCGL